MISVIVSTYNRANKLEQCLHNLINSGDEYKAPWEILVVDNNSSDNTREVVAKSSGSARFPVRYVFESKQGTSHARNRGIAIANHPLIAFTDDDCLVDRNWMGSIHREFAEDPSLSVLGGRVELASPTDRPISIRPYANRTDISSVEQLLTLMIGCNMAFARRVFDRIGVFDPILGPGTRIGSFEEMDLLYRALKKGLKITFSPHVLVYHNHGRATNASVESVEYEYVKGRGAFYCSGILHGDEEILKLAYWEVRRSFTGRSRGFDPAGTHIAAGKLLRNLLAGALYQMWWR